MSEVFQTLRLKDAVAERGATLDGAQPLAGDGSDRRFFRLLGSPTVDPALSPAAARAGGERKRLLLPPGPPPQGPGGAGAGDLRPTAGKKFWMLLEDLGDISLESAIKRQPQEELVRHWYRQALEILVAMQLQGAAGFDPSWCFDTPMVHRPFLWERECGYFVRAFLQGYLGLKMAMDDLAPDFERLLTGALPPGPNYLPAPGLPVPQPDDQERAPPGHRFPGRPSGAFGL